MADNAFECHDREGIRVVCSRETWDSHIVAEHPEMRGCESCVVAAIEAPFEVYQDRAFPNRRSIYRPFILPKPMDRSYLRISVEYKKRKFSKDYRGYVLTAFPVENKRKGGRSAMESVLRGMKPITPDMSTLGNLQTYLPRHDSRRDVFFLRPSTPRPATSIDCGGQFWMRVDVNTGEIIGLEIEDFEAIFLKQHPEVGQAWRTYKRQAAGTNADRVTQSFLVILAGFLRSFLAGCSEQQTMELMPA